MPRINSLHKAATGKLAGQWVGCSAQVSCRNGGVHISRDNMQDLKTALKEHTGRFVPMKEITANDAKKYLDALSEIPKTIAEEERPIKNYNDNFSKDFAIRNIAELNSVTEGNANSFSASRALIVKEYQEVEKSSPVATVNFQLYKKFGGSQPEFLNATFEVKQGELIVKNVIEVDDDEYEDKVQGIINSADSPHDVSVTNWDAADYVNNDIYDYRYLENDTDYRKEIEIIRSFKLTAEQEKQYLDAKKKEKLSKLYPIAADKTFPAWALKVHSHGKSSEVKAEIERKTSKVDYDLTEAKKRYDEARSKASVAQKRLVTVNDLTNKINQAEKMKKASDDKVSIEALSMYIKTETEKKVRAERSYNIAARVSTPETLEKLRQNVETARRAQKDVALNVAGDLRKTYAVEWLAERFPAHNDNTRRFAANAWIREKPEIVEKINNLA